MIRQLALAGLMALAATGSAFAAERTTSTSVATPVMSELLPNAPGKRITANLVTYPPGGGSVSHTHGGSVLAYVLSGQVRSALDNGEVRIYKPGEYFFERPGQTHRVSENASATEPASLLAILVGDDGAVFTTPTAPVR